MIGVCLLPLDLHSLMSSRNEFSPQCVCQMELSASWMKTDRLNIIFYICFYPLGSNCALIFSLIVFYSPHFHHLVSSSVCLCLDSSWTVHSFPLLLYCLFSVKQREKEGGGGLCNQQCFTGLHSSLDRSRRQHTQSKQANTDTQTKKKAQQTHAIVVYCS